MAFKKFLTNMQTMFTGFSDNGDILNDSQNIRLLFQKVHNLILTQIKASFQVSYVFLQRPLRPLSTIVSPLERARCGVMSTTTWRTIAVRYSLVRIWRALIAHHSLVRTDHVLIARQSLARHRTY